MLTVLLALAGCGSLVAGPNARVTDDASNPAGFRTDLPTQDIESGAALYAHVNVPSGVSALDVDLTVGSGTARLVVYGPDFNQACESTDGDCRIEWPAAGTWTIDVLADTFVGDASLSWELEGVPEGAPVELVRRTIDQRTCQTLTLPDSMGRLAVSVGDGSSTSSFSPNAEAEIVGACADESFGDDASCTVDFPEPGAVTVCGDGNDTPMVVRWIPAVILVDQYNQGDANVPFEMPDNVEAVQVRARGADVSLQLGTFGFCDGSEVCNVEFPSAGAWAAQVVGGPTTLRVGAIGEDIVLPDPPPACEDGMIEDCEGNCHFETWVGDDFCDDGGSDGADFMCEPFDFDGGDCDDTPPTDADTDTDTDSDTDADADADADSDADADADTDTDADADTDTDTDTDTDVPDTCSAGEVEDCDGACYDASWVGDGICDDGSGGVDFMCTEHDFDGGDCDDEPDPTTATLVINEIFADPTLLDANCDGVLDTGDDEFLEIVNIGAAPADLSDFTIDDAVANRHTFPGGTIVPANSAIVVFGGGTPSCGTPDVVWQTASTGSLGLNNGGDALLLSAPGGIVAEAAYGSEGGQDASLVLATELDATSGYVLHDSVSATVASPGTRADGSAF